ncbi:MAG: fumarate reductase/succinate dehydrogenase flavoprotein subunit [Candidatus Kariarchaeaceae archaeon]|jgi:succinate dehydrogenase / fumarate reductase flavoprotein subunit
MSDENVRYIDIDVLIIGAGGTGLRAAIAAAEENVSVAVVSKSLLGKAHTVMAEGGVAASFGNVIPEDNWEVHYKDTYKGSGYHGNWRLIEILVKESPERVMELERWGAVWDRTPEGKTLQRNFGGHSYARLAHVGDRTGLEMIRTLEEKVIHCDNVQLFMETTITKLLRNDKEIIGAFGYDRNTGELLCFRSKSIILGSGGVGKVFTITSNSLECTGDGVALAFDAGVELIDMEFIQFHPTGTAYPMSAEGLLVTEGVRGEGGILKNNKGERFMFNYIPEKYKDSYAPTEEEANRWKDGDMSARKPPELLTRDVVASAILDEVKAGRGAPTGGVYLDIASIRDPEYIHQKLPSMWHQFHKLAGLDITKDPMQVAPTAHHMMGGVRVRPEDSGSSLLGLYAAGECAGGLHGANRLGGNALADIVVFGARAGAAAAKYALTKSAFPEISEEMIKDAVSYTLSPYEESNTENPHTLHKELQTIMSDYVVIRTKEKLETALAKLLELKKRIMNAKAEPGRTYNPSWHVSMDLRNMILCSLMIVTAALKREESRGGHMRTDFPEAKPELQEILYILTKDSEGDIELNEDENEPISKELKEMIDRLPIPPT